MAQRIVDLVVDQIDANSESCKTKTIPLTPEPLKNAKAVESYIKDLSGRVNKLGLDPYYGWYLGTVYGKQAEVILEKLKTFKADNIEVALARAEVWFAVHHEMANKAVDFFVRRTGRLYFNIESIALIKEAVMSDLQTYLDWDLQRLTQEFELLDELIYDATHYYEEEMAIS